MTKEKVHVTIDSNEESQNIETVELFVLHEDVENFEIEPLETGDFIVGDCIFERKTPSDFAGSLQEGRLREQADRLSFSKYHPYILVEGNMEDFSNLEHTQIPEKSLRGMTASIMARKNIPVVFCSNPENLADVAIRIARKTVEEPTETHISNDDTVKEAPFIVRFFMNFDGIGLETAEKLSEEFDSVQSVLEASLSDLKQVDGVGDVTAEEIVETVHNTEDNDSNDDSGGVTQVRL